MEVAKMVANKKRYHLFTLLALFSITLFNLHIYPIDKPLAYQHKFPHTPIKRLSPTEEYLNVIPWHSFKTKVDHIDHNVFDELTKIKEEVIKKEKIYSLNYHVFYHAQMPGLFIAQELYKLLYQTVYKQKVSFFEFLRAKNDLHTLSESAQQFLKRHNNNIWDSDPFMRKILLSVNLSFPGNLTWGESSFYFFTSGTNDAPPNLSQLYRTYIKSFYPTIDNNTREQVFLDSIVQQLDSLASLVSTVKRGILLQIFIPKKDVNHCAYLSYAYGKPRYYNTANNTSSTTSKTYDTAISKFLDYMIKNPKKVGKYELTDLQARIILQKNLFGHPNGGIKIHRHHCIPPHILKQCHTELSMIVNKIAAFMHEQPTITFAA